MKPFGSKTLKWFTPERLLVLVACGLALAGCASSSPPAGQTESDPILAPLAFMSGSWMGDTDGMESEERWTEARGGMMLGVSRQVAQGKTMFFEFLRIESTSRGIYYIANPRGGESTPFKLTASGDDRAVFENPGHDFPSRITYWKEPDGTLHARIEGTEDGKPASSDFAWKPRPSTCW